MRCGRSGASIFATALTAGALLLALAGCNDARPSLTQANVAEAQPAATRIAARPGVSPAGATVAFVNLSGAPDAVAARFAAIMSQALGARQISSEESGKAHYLIRGHMSAWPAESGGTAIAYVWDIYGADRRRRQRVEDELAVKSAGPDPWAAADDKILAALAGRSADEIAAFLTNMPEASAPPQPVAAAQR